MFWPSISGRTTPTAPVVCMDEQPVQLVKETRQPIPAAPGRPVRIDYEYERNGTANIFMFTEPLAGWRAVPVTDRRTKVDWAQAVRALLDGRYRGVPTVTLVMDNLNTHTLGSLYEAFPPAEARRLAQRLEMHYTPPSTAAGSTSRRTNSSALTRQCCSRRIGTIQELREQVAAWEDRRNAATVRVNWRFTIDGARGKATPCLPTY